MKKKFSPSSNRNEKPQRSSKAPSSRAGGGRKAGARSQTQFSSLATSKAPSKTRGDDHKQKGPTWPRNWRAIIGNHAILEVLIMRPQSIKQVWFKQGWESSPELKELGQKFRSKNLSIEAVPAPFLDKVSPSHQGVAVFSDRSPEVDWARLYKADKAKVLVLDGIEDPQNLGAILRTAWLMEVGAVMTPEDRSVGLTATVHKVACGGVEHVPVERTTNFSNPLEELKKNGYWVFGLSHEGERSLFDLQIPEKVVWCIGSEEKGLRSTTERLCDELVRIPQLSAAASYNASVATAIALTETYRQQMAKKV